MDREAKAKAFWDRCRAKRNLPGNCTKCGKPNDVPPVAKGKRGICSKCRKLLADYRARKRAKRLALPPEVQVASDLSRRVHVLELRLGRFAKIVRAQYKAGYRVGVAAERKRWRNMPRDWDSWKYPLDVTDNRRMSHRVRPANT